MGRTITHVGPIGAGQAVKAVNQVILAGTYLGVAEGIVLAIRAGLDVEQVVEALGGGAAQSWVLANRSGRMLANEYPLGFKVALHRKDLGDRPGPRRAARARRSRSPPSPRNSRPGWSPRATATRTCPLSRAPSGVSPASSLDCAHVSRAPSPVGQTAETRLVRPDRRQTPQTGGTPDDPADTEQAPARWRVNEDWAATLVGLVLLLLVLAGVITKGMVP